MTGKVTIHMVSSLDGFIAKKDGTISWMNSDDHYEQGAILSEDYIAEFIDEIDCYVMGSRTYDHALELGWPYGDKPVFVVTNRKIAAEKFNVEFVSGDLVQLINRRLRAAYQNIWIVGGPTLIKDLLLLELVDKIVITIVPIILGAGILFFDYLGQEIRLHLKEVATFKDGMVELSYEIQQP